MATTNSTGATNSLYTTYGVKSKGYGGLASGLDTDSLVEAMLSGTKSKIAKQGQKKTLLSWKVSAYRNIISSMNAYQNKYLTYSASSTTNIKSNAFFNTYKATSTSDKVSVSAGSGAVTGDFTIDYVGQLATTATMTNKTKLSTDLSFGVKVGDTFSSETAFSNKVLQLDLDGSGNPKNIKLDSLNNFVVSDGNGGYKLTDSYTVSSYTDSEGNKYDVLEDENGKYYMKDGQRELILNEDDIDNTVYQLEDELQSLLTDAFGTKNVYDANGNKIQARDADNNLLFDSNNRPIYKTENKVTARIEDGKIILDSDTSKLSVYSDCTVLDVAKGKTNRVNMDTKIGAIDAFSDSLVGDVLKFKINGVEISVSKNDTLSTLKSKIDSSSAGVRFDYNQYTDEFTLAAKSSGSGNTIDVQDTQGNLMNRLFGAASSGGVGTNYLVSEGTPTGDGFVSLFFQDLTNDAMKKDIAKNLSNLEFSLTIDGVTKLVKADTSVLNSTKLANGDITYADIIKSLNKGIKNSFSGTSVQFAMERTELPIGMDSDNNLIYGSTGKVVLTASNGEAYAATTSTSYSDYNALSVLGVTSGSIGNAVLKMDYSRTITAGNAIDKTKAPTIGGNISGTFSLTINGETKELEIFNYSSTALNDALKDAFGSTVASKVKFSIANNKITIATTDSNMAINVGKGSTVGEKVDIYDALGFTASTSNNVNLNSENGTTFGQLKGGNGLNAGTLVLTLANGATAEVNYSRDTNLQDFLADINEALGDPSAASIVNGKLSINSGNLVSIAEKRTDEDDVDEDGDYGNDIGNLLTKYFGVSADENGHAGSKAIAESYSGNYKQGQDAEIVINGRTLTSSSNTFSINGASVTINSVSNPGDAPITISVKSDPNDVVERLKTWIEDYNTMLASLNTMIYEKGDSDYTPLTDEQKAEMSETQIKEWEAEAKKGILRNDQTLSKIVNDLRAALYEKVESAGIALYDIGITTKSYSSSDITQSGQLEISDENKLRSMLEKDPDKVRLLFTDENDGLAVRMESIIKGATNTSSVDRGSIVRLAGTDALTGDNTSTLGKQLTSINEYISQLKTRLQTEYNRYWKRFSSLETYIQKMNNQSSLFNS